MMLLQVPYETLNKRFRAAQKNIDRETSHVTMVVAELEKTLSSFPVVDSVVSLLDGVVEKLSALKRKVRNAAALATALTGDWVMGSQPTVQIFPFFWFFPVYYTITIKWQSTTRLLTRQLACSSSCGTHELLGGSVLKEWVLIELLLGYWSAPLWYSQSIWRQQSSWPCASTQVIICLCLNCRLQSPSKQRMKAPNSVNDASNTWRSTAATSRPRSIYGRRNAWTAWWWSTYCAAATTTQLSNWPDRAV